MEASKEKIILNVEGIRHETYCSTLKAFPGTKLCQLTEPQGRATLDYDPDTHEFFFERSARLFGDVLNYYRTKHLHCPADVCRPLWEEELAFWGIPHAQLAPCCWRKLNHPEGPEEEFLLGGDNEDSHEDSLALLGQEERRDYRWWARWQPKIWALFDKPYSSKAAMVRNASKRSLGVGRSARALGMGKGHLTGRTFSMAIHHFLFQES